MENQKLENILNLALSVTESARHKSAQLEVGFTEESRTWELIVKYNGDIGRLRSNVISVEELIAGYAIVTIPENLIDTFAQLDEVEYVEKPKRLFFSTLQGKEASCIFPVTAREPFLTGRNVLIGAIDSGIDIENREFLTPEGRTRIKYLWDQTLDAQEVNEIAGQEGVFAGQAAPPAGYSIGVEFSETRINAALAEKNPMRLVPSRDTSGHGTAVAGIAAGAGNLAEGQYRGVAPESELIVVKLGTPAKDSFPKTTELMRAVTYTVQKAVELGMPVAINLSFGNTYGAHDGSSLLERFLDNVAEIGRTVICVGSGNEGASGGHISGRLLPDGRIRRTELNVGDYQTSISVQLWKEYVDRFLVAIIAPSGERREIDTLRLGQESFILEQTQVLLFTGEPSPYSVNQEIYFDLIPEDGENYITPGIWSFELTPIKTVSGNYDFYLPSNAILNTGTRFFSPTPVKTMTIPSTASKVITVGAYDASLEAYADFSGRGYPLQSIAGERMNQGTVKPDIVAPGVGIHTIGPNNTFVQVTGTSFAVPFAAGSAGLLMEWGIVRGNDPFLYGEKVKAYFRRGARPIRGESVYPNERVGYGALCVSQSLPL